MVVLINHFTSKCDCYETDRDCTVNALLEHVAKTKGYPMDVFKIIYNGRYVDKHDIVRNNSTVHVVLSLCGGKGGFGSMLRAIGAQIEKTTNREACRDLSGRRLRDINEEQRLKRWIAKKAEREREAVERRRRKLEQMCSLPKHEFHDTQYDRERRDLSERIDDSLTHGLKAAIGKKRKLDSDLPTPKKKSCLWIGVDIDGNEHSSEEASSSDDGSSPGVDVSEGTSNADQSEVVTDADSSISKCTDFSSTTQDNVSPIPEIPICDLMESSKTETEKAVDAEALDLLTFQSPEELESLGLDRLKTALQHLGMKCGGTLQQRAERLWLVRGVDPSNISPNLLAKPSKVKK